MSAGAAVRPLRGLLARPVLANSTSLIALRATNLIARLALLFLIAREVTPAAFGLVVFALSVAEIGKVVADFGMDTLAIRAYAAEPAGGAHGRFAATLAAAKIAFGALTYAGLAAWFAWRGPREQAALGLVIGATTLTSLLVNFSLDYFQGRLRIARVFLPAVLSNAALTLAAVLVLPHLGDLRAKAACLPAIELATGLVLLAWFAREDLRVSPAPAPAQVAGLARASLPVAVTGIVIMLYSRLDVIVLSSRLPAAAVGQYGMAFRLTEPFQIAAAAFALSVFSRFSTWFADPGAGSLRRPALRYAGATLAYGATVAATLGLAAPPLLARLFPAYAPAIPVLRVLAGALVFRSLNATLAGIIQGAGRFRLLTIVAAWNLVVVYALLRVLVGRQGPAGAAFALLAAEGVNSILQAVIVARLIATRERTAAHDA